MLHPVYLLIGSNIRPEENVQAAIACLQTIFEIRAVSPIWETPAIGSEGPNFLNLVIEIASDLEPEPLKYDVLRQIETRLGRVRKADKNAPRTIDLDILIHDRVVMEPSIWLLAHIACPLSGLLPDLVNPRTGEKLSQIAAELQKQVPVRLRDDVRIEVKPPV